MKNSTEINKSFLTNKLPTPKLSDASTCSVGLWVGTLGQGKTAFEDWGEIRDDNERIIYRASIGIGVYSDEAEKHRKEDTDPSQARVDILLESFSSCIDIFHDFTEDEITNQPPSVRSAWGVGKIISPNV